MRSAFEQRAKEIERRKKELGLDQVPVDLLRNSGVRRTESKKQLLQAIDDNARKQGREPTFKANF